MHSLANYPLKSGLFVKSNIWQLHLAPIAFQQVSEHTQPAATHVQKESLQKKASLEQKLTIHKQTSTCLLFSLIRRVWDGDTENAP